LAQSEIKLLSHKPTSPFDALNVNANITATTQRCI
jgi:hypothetical protein